MNTTDTARLRELLGAATKGPWEVEIEEYGNSGSVTVTGLKRLLHDTEWADPEDFEQDQANAHCIAELHNAAPALLAELDALRARVAELEALVEWASVRLEGVTAETKVSDIHLHTNKGCRWDTIDLCPLCAAVTQETK